MGLVLNPAAFKVMIEKADPRLIGFFDMMVNAIIPSARLAYNKEEAKKNCGNLLHYNSTTKYVC